MTFLDIWSFVLLLQFLIAMWGWGKAKKQVNELRVEKLEDRTYYIKQLRSYEKQVQDLQTRFPIELVEMVKRVGQNCKEEI